MKRYCCVPACRAIDDGHITSTFSFPKEEARRQQWIKAISRIDFTPSKSSGVCMKHFAKQFIITEDTLTRDDGTQLTVKRGRPALTKDA